MDPAKYQFYSWTSLFCSIFTLVGLYCGFFTTHFDKRLVTLRNVYLLAQCIYFLRASFAKEDELKSGCPTWTSLFGPFFVLNQFSFLVVCWDIFQVFHHPFRTKKYSPYVPLVPLFIAILSIPVIALEAEFEYREELGLCWVKAIGNSTHLNTWNLVYIFLPGAITLTIGVLTAIFIFLRLKVGAAHLGLCCPILAKKRKDLSLFLRTNSGANKILITVEVFACILGYVVFYSVSGTFYILYYIFELGDRNNAQYFIRFLIMQSAWELALVLGVNGYLRMKQHPKCLSEDSYSKLDYSPSFDESNEDALAFEFFLQKRVIQQLEYFITKDERQEDFGECLEIQSHLPDLFEEIRQLHGIEHTEYCEEFVNISKKFNEGLTKQLLSGNGGASGAIFCPTISKRFYIKKLENSEAAVLLKIIPELRKLWEVWPNSLINRIFGLYSVKIMSRRVWFQVMDYLFFDMPGKKPTEIYDLKGSEFKRRVGKNPLAGHVLKDRDFRQPVLLPKSAQEELAKRLTIDSSFLANKKIMDYSLLVGVLYEEMPEKANMEIPEENYRQFKRMPCGKTRQLTMYSFGIIDYLQKWNNRKRMESFAWHSLLRCWACFMRKPQPEVSAVASDAYQVRFRRNVLGKLFGEESIQIADSSARASSLSVNSRVTRARRHFEAVMKHQRGPEAIPFDDLVLT